MQLRDINAVLADRIFKMIPPHVKPVDYLMETLGLARESIYRRKRGELPFGFDEIVTLSRKLEFSIDDILGRDKPDTILFKLHTNVLHNPEETFVSMLEEYKKLLKREAGAASIETVVTQNRVLLIFSLGYPHLLKFFFYKWKHQGYQVPLNFYYADVALPPGILSLSGEITSLYRNPARRNIFIFDPSVFKNTMKEISYYYGRKLITHEELWLICRDMSELVRYTESLVKEGTGKDGSAYCFYISTQNVESNTLYATYDGLIESFLWLYYVNPVHTDNKYMCATHKRYIDALKRSSSLITNANEALRDSFYKEQYDFLRQIASGHQI